MRGTAAAAFSRTAGFSDAYASAYSITVAITANQSLLVAAATAS
jgi:hypothetical protein